MLRREFSRINQTERLWGKQQNVLLAVSGGVDSMVLLDLFCHLPEAQRPTIGVAHVNHQLREESQVEAAFLKAYCETRHIPYYERRWSVADQQGNIEGSAREMRYTFFSDICQREGYDCLVTAHHGDDQAETVLMKLTNGSQLQNLVGIREKSQRAGMTIFRPLLYASKADLLDYAARREVPFFEDPTNQGSQYYRNRIRNQVMPKLKTENANFLKHIHSFVKQIEYANDMIDECVTSLLPKIVKKQTSESWELDLETFLAQTESLQYFILVAFFQQTLVDSQIEVNEQQLLGTLSLFTSEKAQGALHLAEGWRIIKRYQRGYLLKEALPSVEMVNKTCFQLMPGDSCYLSTGEWFGMERTSEPLSIPPAIANWQRSELLLATRGVELPLIVRHPQAGDRFMFNQEGQTKGVNRLFIDTKTPAEKRLKTWLVSDSLEVVLWIISIRKSYLSIGKETDKIHYRLIYLKNEQDLEGDSYVGERH